jgi:hypothetical protein
MILKFPKPSGDVLCRYSRGCFYPRQQKRLEIMGAEGGFELTYSVDNT